jgi:hypothetical protein
LPLHKLPPIVVRAQSPDSARLFWVARPQTGFFLRRREPAARKCGRIRRLPSFVSFRGHGLPAKRLLPARIQLRVPV